MKGAPECFPCSLNQVLKLMRVAGADDETILRAIKDSWEAIKAFGLEKSPAYVATVAIRKAKRYFPVDDPYRGLKSQHNELAADMLERIKPILDSSPDPLKAALIVMASGNIIDLGVHHEFDLEGTLRRNLEEGFARDDYEYFRDRLDRASSLLLIADNAGEIVFDLHFLKSLSPGLDRYIAVKEGPILNDVTISEMSGFDTGDVKVVSTGSDGLGVIFDEVSEDFMKLFEEADIVIAKGHANFETLDEAEREIFLLFQVKCQVVARRTGTPVGRAVFLSNRSLARQEGGHHA